MVGSIKNTHMAIGTNNELDYLVHRVSVDAFRSLRPRFEIVTYEQFKKDMISAFNEYEDSDDSEIKEIYNSIEFPTRATSGSAGYDFKSPFYFYIKPGESIMIPIGIRAYMPSSVVLLIFPRSGLGTKYRVGLANSTAVIDSDYYEANNEGHIHIKLVNDGDKTVTIEKGKAFAQGVFTHYLTAYGDSAHNTRHGGLGSTDSSYMN